MVGAYPKLLLTLIYPAVYPHGYAKVGETPEIFANSARKPKAFLFEELELPNFSRTFFDGWGIPKNFADTDLLSGLPTWVRQSR